MPASAPFPDLPMPRGVLHASMISASTMVFPLGLFLQAFEDGRVWESIRPADNLFHDPVGALLVVLFIVLISTSHSRRVAKPVRFTIIRTAGQIIRGLSCGNLRGTSSAIAPAHRARVKNASRRGREVRFHP